MSLGWVSVIKRPPDKGTWYLTIKDSDLPKVAVLIDDKWYIKSPYDEVLTAIEDPGYYTKLPKTYD
jgi:hypothetical protein